MNTHLTYLCRFLLAVSWPAALAHCAPEAAPIPIVEGLGTHSFQVTTRSQKAQQYFDQGLRFLFGFNHGAAIRSFQEAARLDPECAMAHWGIAYANGPHINFPVVPPPAAEQAWNALQLARSHAAKATPFEQALIEALGTRYVQPPQPDDRRSLDEAYANAMRDVWKRFPQSADAGVLFVESMMDLRPWDQWTPAGEPQPGTEEILATLDAVLKLNLDHPFANHLYIHAVEASHQPGRALAAADRLLTLQPGLAHNVHMPSHIYIRVGQWQQAIDSNLAAVKADRAYRRIVGPATGLLPLYVAHNQHMLAYAAMMSGQRKLALSHIRGMVRDLPADFLRDFEFAAEAFLAMPLEVMVRFGQWDEVLAEPDHPSSQKFTNAFQHAARGIAFAAKGDLASARKEQALYLDAAKAVPADQIAAGNNTCHAVLAIVTPMLEGEILVHEKRIDEGFAQLRAAIAEEDKLKYDEPPAWLIPVRHALGAALMANGRHAEAAEVYREDLARLPNNGWSLFGLSEALVQLRKFDEARSVREQYQLAWSKADTTITSSCFCQPGSTGQ
ncbi:MAG: tetratricopeptide repeat protein [Opitutaceae bacterium]|nr:tetratricopeptide repeat protein [Opitutaceae bacterium]